MKINTELFQKNIKNGKKLILTKVAPIALSAGIMMGGSIVASAATVEIPVISSNSTGTDVDYSTYTSSNVSESLAKQMEEVIDNIDTSYNELYDTMASGGMDITHTKSVENSIARLLASINKIENEYQSVIDDMKSTAKKTLNKYLESKKLEAKLLFANLTNISLKEINNFEDEYSCVFANSITNNSLVNIGIYEIKNNQIISNTIVSIDDTNLNKNKSLIKIPSLEVTYKSATSAVPTFTTTYDALIISKESANACDLAIKELDEMYSKVEEAINKGNYTKSTSQDKDDIYVSIYGDTNLINQTIKTKYSQVKDYEAINKYMTYKQNLMISKVYSKNSRSINYLNYEQFNKNNEVVRISNENGYVYYKLNGKIYPIIDKEIITTSDLTNSNVSLSQETEITVATGLNIYVDGQLFIPTDASGKKVDSFVYNGVSYVPLRAISSLYNIDVNWDSKTNSVYLTVKEVDKGLYYFDENGKKVYLDSLLPEVPTTNASPNKEQVNKKISVSKNIKIYYNNELLQLPDSNGNPMTVLVSNGTTYVPLRPIFTLFGSEIEWKQETFSAVITRGEALTSKEKEVESDYYYYDESGKKVPVKEENIDFGNTVTGKEYYYDENGNKVYLEFDKKLSLHL